MAFPTTNILDNFNRANENPLSFGGKWTKPTYGTFDAIQIVSNVADPTTNNANDCMAYWNVQDFGPDCEVFATVSNSAVADAFLILHARFDVTNGNGYKVDWDNATSRIRVFRVDAGVRTQLGANITQSMASGDSLGMSIIGTTITVYYKASGGSWTSLGTRTDSTYSAAGKVMLGMWDFANLSTYDDFGGGTVGVSSSSSSSSSSCRSSSSSSSSSSCRSSSSSSCSSSSSSKSSSSSSSSSCSSSCSSSSSSKSSSSSSSSSCRSSSSSCSSSSSSFSSSSSSRSSSSSSSCSSSSSSKSSSCSSSSSISSSSSSSSFHSSSSSSRSSSCSSSSSSHSCKKWNARDENIKTFADRNEQNIDWNPRHQNTAVICEDV